MKTIMDAKTVAKELRSFAKNIFPDTKCSVKTKNKEIDFSFYDIDLEIVEREINIYLDFLRQENQLDVKEIYYWKEFSNQYMKENPKWGKDERGKRVKFEKVQTENSDVIINNVVIFYKDKNVYVTMTGLEKVLDVEFEYRKSWSNRKYLEMAFDQTGAKKGSNLSYSWDMTLLA